MEPYERFYIFKVLCKRFFSEISVLDDKWKNYLCKYQAEKLKSREMKEG